MKKEKLEGLQKRGGRGGGIAEKRRKEKREGGQESGKRGE